MDSINQTTSFRTKKYLNQSECFADITELEGKDLTIYFAHPYSSWERGSNAKHNGLLR